MIFSSTHDKQNLNLAAITGLWLCVTFGSGESGISITGSSQRLIWSDPWLAYIANRSWRECCDEWQESDGCKSSSGSGAEAVVGSRADVTVHSGAEVVVGNRSDVVVCSGVEVMGVAARLCWISKSVSS